MAFKDVCCNWNLQTKNGKTAIKETLPSILDDFFPLVWKRNSMKSQKLKKITDAKLFFCSVLP